MATDVYPDAEVSVWGDPAGSIADLAAADNVYLQIDEDLSNGSPPVRFSRYEHQLQFTLPAGAVRTLYVQGFRTASLDHDDVVFEVSEDGGSNWSPITMGGGIWTSDRDAHARGELSLSFSSAGTIWIRVTDTDRAEGNQGIDTLWLDEVYVRSRP